MTQDVNGVATAAAATAVGGAASAYTAALH